MPPSIRVDRVSKRYRIRASSGPAATYRTLRDDLSGLLTWPLRRLRGAGRSTDFWALRDVDLEVQPGERVGIIGRNGAGKSTLLKVISRVTRPSAGESSYRGRLASLLEVGTGFHPELTGRENVFLGAAIQGMSRAEVRRKFDEIVAFAEVEQFLDTPVKRYSSGMYVRLAFSVAAHLDPDVLIIDEVLAVGDAAFQKKCLGRMQTMAQGGETVLLVSHNPQAIRSFCTRAVQIEAGQVVQDGSVESVLGVYNKQLTQLDSLAGANLRDRLKRCSGFVRFTGLSVLDDAGNPRTEFATGETVCLRCEMEVLNEVQSLGFLLQLLTGTNHEPLAVVKKVVSDGPLRPGERLALTVRLVDCPLQSGGYGLYLWLGDSDFGRPHDVLDANVSLPELVIRPATEDPEAAGGGYVRVRAECSVEGRR